MPLLRPADISFSPSGDHTGPLQLFQPLWQERARAARAAIEIVEKAMEVVGGGSFYRQVGLERLLRDVKGARSTIHTRKSANTCLPGVWPLGSISSPISMLQFRHRNDHWSHHG